MRRLRLALLTFAWWSGLIPLIAYRIAWAWFQ